MDPVSFVSGPSGAGRREHRRATGSRCAAARRRGCRGAPAPAPPRRTRPAGGRRLPGRRTATNGGWLGGAVARQPRVWRSASRSSRLRSRTEPRTPLLDLVRERREVVHGGPDVAFQLGDLAGPGGQLGAARVGDLVDLAPAGGRVPHLTLGLHPRQARVDRAGAGRVVPVEPVLQQADQLVAVLGAVVEQLEQVEPQPPVAEDGGHAVLLGAGGPAGRCCPRWSRPRACRCRRRSRPGCRGGRRAGRPSARRGTRW